MLKEKYIRVPVIIVTIVFIDKYLFIFSLKLCKFGIGLPLSEKAFFNFSENIAASRSVNITINNIKK